MAWARSSSHHVRGAGGDGRAAGPARRLVEEPHLSFGHGPNLGGLTSALERGAAESPGSVGSDPGIGGSGGGHWPHLPAVAAGAAGVVAEGATSWGPTASTSRARPTSSTQTGAPTGPGPAPSHGRGVGVRPRRPLGCSCAAFGPSPDRSRRCAVLRPRSVVEMGHSAHSCGGCETADMAEGEQHRSFCRICNAMCGIVVTVGTDGSVEQVRGDADHALSRGYTCPKGRAIPSLHHDPRRLDRPLVGRGDDRTAAAGTTCSTTCTPDWSRPSTPTVPTRSPCTWPAGRRSTPPAGGPPSASSPCSGRGSATRPPPSTRRASRSWPSWSADGRASPRCGTRRGRRCWCSSAATRWCRTVTRTPCPIRWPGCATFQARGGAVWVLDPRRTETARLADRHLQLRPGDRLDRAGLAGATPARPTRTGGPTARRQRDGRRTARRGVWAAVDDTEMVSRLTGVSDRRSRGAVRRRRRRRSGQRASPARARR